MHSRIFQLSDEKIKKNNYVRASDFYEDSFIGSVADYVSDDIDRKEDIKWLMERLKPYGAILNKKEESIFFPKGFKKKYFSKKFEELKKMVNEMTLEEFIDGITAYKLEQIIESKFDFYIYIEYLQPLDDFVRGLEEGKKYYIGGIVNYHA
jgi:oligoribonuclease NrnB/cAMP/cGMP phosphodiesterase (DHH superfamily)